MLLEIEENRLSLSSFSEVHNCKPSRRVNASAKTTNKCKCRMKTQGMESFYSVALLLLFASRLFTRSSVLPLQKGIGATFYWLDVFFVSYLKAPVYLRFLGLALLEVHCLCVRLVRFFFHMFYSFERGVSV